MTTTIKVTDETKQLLDMLQAKMTLVHRKKKTLSEIIDTIVKVALRHEDELFNAENLKNPSMKPLSRKRGRADAGKVSGYIYTEE